MIRRLAWLWAGAATVAALIAGPAAVLIYVVCELWATRHWLRPHEFAAPPRNRHARRAAASAARRPA